MFGLLLQIASHYQNDNSALKIRNVRAALYEYHTNNCYLVIEVDHKTKSLRPTCLDYKPIPDGDDVAEVMGFEACD